ncbi:hypothetical protein AAJ76_1160002200 [Vairimorpha ceranae]|uniref:Uncharacterized protein n=1 Tax=Vairimorpha ceranae TaxID=40302 RepID=A0A0F9W8T4_9MICR|nr:hypothetical protein AAJ76_1160002200 [Vairimorpha ceranae]KKO74116.1 hypothetical protein AAJ76_1160002200 [Vairimorpha ceranae]
MRRNNFFENKKFNLDGLDGYNYCWVVIKTKEVVYSRGATGGSLVMV